VLSYELRSPIPWLPIGQGLALLVTIVLAAPAVRRPDLRDPMRDARRVATVGADGRSPLDTGLVSQVDDLGELTSTSGLITVSDGLTTSTGKRGLLSTSTLEALQRGDLPDDLVSHREERR
jgi:hypothetical protein